MFDPATKNSLATIQRILAALGEAGIAVSGGVDSMTLATIAGRTPQCAVTMFHAVSPAVPGVATERVIEHAKKERWNLRIIDAGELSTAAYVQNPVNRCFHCKHQLYSTIRGSFKQVILSGTNIDDLSDFRPGLEAAKALDVRHPYVEAGVDKARVRQLASFLGMPKIANLAASPCLASRVETGIPISKERLRVIEESESLLLEALGAITMRCRIVNDGFRIELDEKVLSSLTTETKDQLKLAVERIGTKHGVTVLNIMYGPYRRGSAFLAGPISNRIRHV